MRDRVFCGTVMKTTTFNKITEGDEVLFYPRSVMSPPEHAKVEKVTTSRFMVRGTYFDRKKGYACGHGQNPYPPVVQLIKKGAAAETNSPFPVAAEAPRAVLNRMLEQLADLETQIMTQVHKLESAGMSVVEEPPAPTAAEPQAASTEAEATKQE